MRAPSLKLEGALAIGLRVVDVPEREREAERQWLSAFHQMTGIAAERFAALAVEHYARRKLDGSPRRDATRFSKVVRTPRNGLMPAAAERVLRLLRDGFRRSPEVVEEICGKGAAAALLDLERRLSAN